MIESETKRCPRCQRQLPTAERKAAPAQPLPPGGGQTGSPASQTNRRSFLIACTCLAIGLASGWTAGVASGRPATAEEARVIVDAAQHLTAISVPTVAPPVFVEDTPADTCGPDAYACTDQLGHVIWTLDAAIDARVYAHMSAHPLRLRRRSLDECYWRCAPIMQTALHELAHVDRILTVGYGAMLRDIGREEGIAEAVAHDQTCPFIYRATRTRSCFMFDEGYADDVAAIRTESARAVGGPWRSYQARRWRLSQLVGTVAS